jgi:hypothetical protein
VRRLFLEPRYSLAFVLVVSFVTGYGAAAAMSVWVSFGRWGGVAVFLVAEGLVLNGFRKAIR